jgi:hypothetical protein
MVAGVRLRVMVADTLLPATVADIPRRAAMAAGHRTAVDPHTVADRAAVVAAAGMGGRLQT